jgi:hypothetical protein
MVHQYNTGQTPDAVSVPLHTRRQRCQEGEVIGEGVSPLHRLPYAWSLYPQRTICVSRHGACSSAQRHAMRTLSALQCL